MTNEWKDTIINDLVCCEILTKEHESNPRKALHALISWNVMVALDPSVSSEAQALIDRGCEKELDAIQTACELIDLESMPAKQKWGTLKRVLIRRKKRFEAQTKPQR